MKKRKGKLSFRVTLILVAMIPLLLSIMSTSLLLVNKAKDEIKEINSNYLRDIVVSEGQVLEKDMATKGTDAFDVINLRSIYYGVGLKGVSSSYAYVVAPDTTMLYHPTATKIGEPVTNSVVKGLCADMQAGKKVDSDVVSYDFNGVIKYAAYYADEGQNFILVISADEDDILSEAATMARMGMMIAALFIVIFFVLAVLAARIIATPLKKTSEHLAVLATGDMTKENKTNSIIKEVANLLNSADDLHKMLTDSIGQVNAESEVLTESIGEVHESMNNNIEQVEQINTAITEVAQTSQQVAEEAQILSERAVDMGVAIDSIVESIDNLQKASNEINDINSAAVDSMNGVLASSDESAKAVAEISLKIADTNKAVNRIQECVTLIEEIAEQTNLLSLNASIEAARAGELGKGFAVVAGEIRNLADGSAQSAQEIKSIVESVMVLSDETVAMAGKVTERIEEERKSVDDTQNKFGMLSESVGDSIQAIQFIQTKAEGLDQIKQQLTEATTNLGAISEELGASAEEVSASCTTVAEVCTLSGQEVDAMAKANTELLDSIAVFKMN